jgi:hypothetical protein
VLVLVIVVVLVLVLVGVLGLPAMKKIEHDGDHEHD